MFLLINNKYFLIEFMQLEKVSLGNRFLQTIIFLVQLYNTCKKYIYDEYYCYYESIDESSHQWHFWICSLKLEYHFLIHLFNKTSFEWLLLSYFYIEIRYLNLEIFIRMIYLMIRTIEKSMPDIFLIRLIAFSTLQLLMSYLLRT